MAERYIPKNPTRGWMFSELDRLGHSCRGQDVSNAQLAARLKKLGVVVDDKPGASTETSGQKDPRLDAPGSG